MIGTLFLRSYERGERIYTAMQARGFEGRTAAHSIAGLAGFGARSSSHLSVGEKKRAAIATVYSMYPEVYVFDEPTSSLDPRGRKSIIALLKKLGKTQVIISNDLAMIAELCSRIVVMDNGMIVADGKTETVLSDAPMLESCGLL